MENLAFDQRTNTAPLQAVAHSLSGKSSTNKTGFTLQDNRPQAAVQRRQVEAMAAKNQLPVQKKENKTGLPDNLKSGIENLSGYSMDDVKVHYNSAQPAQLNAHAYAQGNQIHVAPGQEKHLPHEAWHVVQQKQGRVKPTKQLKGKTNINDDAGLEKEADVMGNKALQMKENNAGQQSKNSNTSTTYQLYTENPEGKLSVNGIALVSKDNKNLYIRANRFIAERQNIENTDNSKVTFNQGDLVKFKSIGDVGYIKAIPVLKPQYIEQSLVHLGDHYQEIDDYIGKSDQLTGGRGEYRNFLKNEKTTTGNNIVLPNDCRLASDQLQEDVSNESVENPDLGSNYHFSQEDGIQGTLEAALKAWNFHYASVILKDTGINNTDNVTLEAAGRGFVNAVKELLTQKIAENASMAALQKYAGFIMGNVQGKSLGYFEMYGTQQTSQSFQYITYYKLIKAMLEQASVNAELICSELEEGINKNYDHVKGTFSVLDIKLGSAEDEEDRAKITKEFLSRSKFKDGGASSSVVQDEDDYKHQGTGLDEDIHDEYDLKSNSFEEEDDMSGQEFNPLMLFLMAKKFALNKCEKLLDVQVTFKKALSSREKEIGIIAEENEDFIPLLKMIGNLKKDLDYLENWTRAYIQRFTEEPFPEEEPEEIFAYFLSQSQSLENIVAGEFVEFQHKIKDK